MIAASGKMTHLACDSGSQVTMLVRVGIKTHGVRRP